MTITTDEAAKKICVLSGWTITNLRLQKILYLAHMSYLGIYKEPLIDELFQACDYGPVLPSLYKKLEMFGNRKVRDIFYGTEIIKFADLLLLSVHQGRKKFAGKEALFLEYFVPNFIEATDARLVTLTQFTNGAWAKVYMNYNNVITNDDILKEYVDDIPKQEDEEMNLKSTKEEIKMNEEKKDDEDQMKSDEKGISYEIEENGNELYKSNDFLTVDALIALLKKLPKDAIVGCFSGHFSGYVDTIILDKQIDWNDGNVMVYLMALNQVKSKRKSK